jgi:hypothetical protein
MGIVAYTLLAVKEKHSLWASRHLSKTSFGRYNTKVMVE